VSAGFEGAAQIKNPTERPGEMCSSERDSVADVHLGATSCQFNFEDLAPLFHDPLLLSKPTLVGNPLGEVGVLKLTLGAAFFGAGDAGCDFEQTHGKDP
jgi:hypothetical protein